MERLLILTAAILLNCTAFAAGTNPAPTPVPATEDITLSANLNISTCTDSGGGFQMCTSEAVSSNAVVVTLQPDKYNQYVGHHVMLEVRDGLRFIAIISITRYEAVFKDGSRRPHYYMTAEILDGGATAAKMSVDFYDVTKIPAATLYGGNQKVGPVEYRPLLSISRFCDPNSTDCSNSVAPLSDSRWTVLQGQLL